MNTTKNIGELLDVIKPSHESEKNPSEIKNLNEFHEK